MIKSVESCTIDIDRSEFRYILKRILKNCKRYLNYARDDVLCGVKFIYIRYVYKGEK